MTAAAYLGAMSSRRLRVLAAAAAVAGGLLHGGPAQAQAPLMNVTASPGTLSITTAVAGSPPINAIETTTRYSTNTLVALSTSRISARLSSALPAGASLTITLAAQSGATSSGPVTLTATDQTVVTGIPILSTASNLQITYVLSATSAAGVIPSSSRTVTLTIGAQ